MEDQKKIRDETNEDSINIIDYLIVPAKRKNIILILTLSVAIITITFSSLRPPLYTAITKVLPPSTGNTRMSSLLNQLPGFISGNFSRRGDSLTSKAVLVNILYSGPVIEIFISKLRSMERYKEQYDDIDKTKAMLNRFKGIVSAKENRERPSSIIEITAVDRDPVTAADMANIAVEALNERLQQLTITDVSQSRIFFEKELEKSKENLVKSEQEMIDFQEKTGILAVEGKINITVNKFAPELLLEYTRKLRQVKLDEKIFEVILTQYKSAMVDERRNTPMLQIIEKAVPPEHAYQGTFRKTVKNTFIAFFLSILIVFILEYIEKSSRNKETNDKVEALKKYLSFKRN